MKEIWEQFTEVMVRLFKGFGSNRPVAAMIRLMADLPDSRDLIPDKLCLNTIDGCCPVCGESFVEEEPFTDQGEGTDYVICKDCFTPHHRQCFEWNGKCAQYACGSKETHKLTALFSTEYLSGQRLRSPRRKESQDVVTQLSS